MHAFPGYQVEEKLCHNARSLLWRARRLADGRAVLIKCLPEANPGWAEVAHLRREFTIMAELEMPGVPAVLELGKNLGAYYMIMEDPGGVSLASWIHNAPLPADPCNIAANPGCFLGIACKMTALLDMLHRQHIIHKDFVPSSMLYNPESGAISIIEFRAASRRDREYEAGGAPPYMEGSLAYISPEQTGRMNRNPDCRSDLYTLGTSMYELACGKLPFASHDPAELIHCHLAMRPSPLAMLNPAVPGILSEMINRLMAKDADERYQTARGVLADLQACQGLLSSRGKISSFPLGRRDLSGKLLLNRGLFGRKRQLDELEAALYKVSNGGQEVVLVCGAEGSGKTALVNHFNQHIAPQNCFLMPGAFEKGENRPYRAFIQGFRALIRQMQAGSEDSMRNWQQSIFRAIGEDGDLAVELVPELKPMLNLDPEALKGISLSREAQETGKLAKLARLESVVKRCLGILSSPEHPLIIFLDNLQWADPLSLQLLESLAGQDQPAGQLIIAAVRETERERLEPFWSRISCRREELAGLTEVKLKPLKSQECRQWLSLMLGLEAETARDLARMIAARTGGNPARVIAMLESLLDREVLSCDSETGEWKWDREAVSEYPVADTVLENMLQHLRKMPSKKLNMLTAASVIGREFDLESLAFICGQPENDLVPVLSKAVREGLLEKLEAACPWEGGGTPDQPKYRFAQSQMRDSLYALLPESESQDIHYRYGRRLASLQADGRPLRLREVVDHLNRAVDLMASQEERRDLAELNLEAGRQAIGQNDCQSGLAHYRSALALIEDKGWMEDYDGYLALHMEAAQAAFRCGEYRTGSDIAATAISHVDQLLGKVPFWELLMDILLAQNRLCQALETGLKALRQLGMELPASPSWQDVGQLIEEARDLLKARQSEELSLLPPVQEPEKLAVMGLLAKMTVPARITTAELFAVINLKQVIMSLEYGSTRELPCAYAYYGMILCAFANETEEGYRMGEIALKMAAAGGDSAIEAAVHQLNLRYIRPWKDPLRQVAPGFLEAYHKALASGERLEAASAMANYCIHLASSGCELGQMADTMASGAVIIRQMNQELYLQTNEIFRQMVLNLRGESSEPAILKGSAYDETVMLPRHIRDKNRAALAQLYFCKMYLSYLFGDTAEAAEYASLCEEYLSCMMGSILEPLYHFYSALIYLARFPAAIAGSRAEILNRVAISQQKMKVWAEQCPVNNRQRYLLVEAEFFRVLGRNTDAMDAYDQAIKLARKHEYYQEEALALELAALFYSSRGNVRIASLYMRDARLAYLHWGARAKVEDLDRIYASLLGEILTGPETPPKQPGKDFAREASLAENLDIDSTLKASQAISQEIVLERLLDRLMTVLLENAGAERGFLVLKQNEGLVVEAEMKSGDQAVRLLQSVPLEQVKEQFASAVVNLVARTGENLLISGEDGLAEFNSDKYLMVNRPRSVLCLPIMSRGQILGVLYLENRLASHVFPPERVEVLSVLASQAAIALENARLYADLEHRVQERTRALAAANLNLQKEISQRLKAEEYIRHLAYHDTLTGLANRKLFQERLGQEIARAGRSNSSVAVLFLDLDGFKDVNDSYGHETGDMVLCEVASRLKSSLREFDMASRLGGDEFTLFITGVENQADVQSVLDRIQEAFRLPLMVAGQSLKVSASIGVSLFPLDGAQPEELISKADQAMYRAKRDHRQGFCYYQNSADGMPG